MEQKNIIAKKLFELAEAYDLADIYLFGSRAKGIAAMVRGDKMPAKGTASDADVGIRPSPGRRLAPREMVRLTLALEDLLSVNRVDLISLPDTDPFLALDIVRGELIFTRDAADQARYELFVLRRAGDLLPLKKTRIEMIVRGRGQ
jgi:uncharacterized protein